MKSQSADWRRLRIMFVKQIDMIEALRLAAVGLPGLSR